MQKFISIFNKYKLEYDSKYGFRTYPSSDSDTEDFIVNVRHCTVAETYIYGMPAKTEYNVIVDLDKISVPYEIADTFDNCCTYQLIDNKIANYSISRCFIVHLLESNYGSHHSLNVKLTLDVMTLELEKDSFTHIKKVERKLPLKFNYEVKEYDNWLSIVLVIYASVGILYNLVDVPYGEDYLKILTDKTTYKQIEKLLNWLFGGTLSLSESLAQLELWNDAFQNLKEDSCPSEITNVLLRKWNEKKNELNIVCNTKFKRNQL
jgi:hypothetical protein